MRCETVAVTKALCKVSLSGHPEQIHFVQRMSRGGGIIVLQPALHPDSYFLGCSRREAQWTNN